MKMWNKIIYMLGNKDYPRYGKISKWLDPSWYRYIFKPWKGLRVMWCRMRGHPCGVVWFNPGGLEPDMTCLNCEEDLG